MIKKRRPPKPPNFISFATDISAAVEKRGSETTLRMQRRTPNGEIHNIVWNKEDLRVLRNFHRWMHKAIRHLETL